MTIIIAKGGQKAHLLEPTHFKNEAELQSFITANPTSIPLNELNSGEKLCVVAKEFWVNSGRTDVLAIDEDGNIYIIETKLNKNPDKRGVVAQILNYGAALWKHTTETDFLTKIEDYCQSQYKQSLRVKLKESFNVGDEAIEQIVENVKLNFNEGVIKFIILMDAVDDRLKDLILYLNENSKFDIYAVEFKYHIFEDMQIIVPNIFGNEVRKTVSTGRTKLDLNTFMNTLPDDQTKQVFRELLGFSDTIGAKPKCGAGSVTIQLVKSNEGRQLKLSLFHLKKSGEIGFAYLGWQLKRAGLSDEPAQEMYQKLAELFNARVRKIEDGGLDREIKADELKAKMAEFKAIITKAIDDIDKMSQSL